MSFLSRLSIAAANFDFEGKKLFRALSGIATIAAAGSVSTDATALSAGKNMVTAADGTKGVILPRAEPEMAVTVVNTVSTQDLKVYPAASAQINALTATTGAFTIPGGQEATFHCDVLLHWYVSTGSGASAAELEVLNGATSTNATTGKAAILGTGGAVQFGGAVTATGSFIIGAADLDETDLEKLDGITNGTAAASKAVVADANIDVAGLRRISAVNTNASATPGTVRDIYGKQVTGISLTSGNLVGTRGEVTVTNATNVGAGVFLYGAQGKIITGTGTIDTGSGMVYGVMGQLDVTGGTVTSGYVAAVGADIFGVSAGTVAVDMFYGQHADGGTIHSYLRAYGKSEVVFDFESNGGASVVIGAGTYSTADGYLLAQVNGGTYRIALFSAAD